MAFVKRNTWLPSRTQMGLGQTATCPSVEQLQGITDSNDPCQNPLASLPILGTLANPTTTGGFTCFNEQTQQYYGCNTAGQQVSSTPAGTVNGSPLSVTSTNWWILAAVLAGFVVLSEVAK